MVTQFASSDTSAEPTTSNMSGLTEAAVLDTPPEAMAPVIDDDTPVAEPAPAAPAPDVVPRSDFEALRQEFEQVKGTLTERQTQEQQQQARVRQEQTQQQRVAVRQQFVDYGFPQEHAAKLTEAVELYAFLNGPEGAKRMQQFQKNEMVSHTWDQILANFPPQTTLATLREHFAEISKFPDAERREWSAKERAKMQIANNRQTRINSGAERTEGGGLAAAGATDENVLIQRVSNGTATPQEESRLELIWQRKERGR